jgi:hydrogenase nickel incorporation protein HypA/HybF
MHELAVTESIKSIAEKHAKEAHATRVTGIFVTLGQLSSIVDDSVQFYWDIISKDSLCEGAALHFNRVPARLQCQSCRHEYGIEYDMEPCPQCGSFQVKVIAGEEFWLDSIEVERDEEEISE